VGTVHTVADRRGIGDRMRLALDDARGLLGVSTLIVPADFQQEYAPEPAAPVVGPRPRPPVAPDRITFTAARLKSAGARAVVLLGGNALTRAGQQAAAGIAAATGARLYCETFPARVERGGGLPAIDRLPYFPEVALAALQDAEVVVVAGAVDPIAYFGYHGMPSVLTRPDQLCPLAQQHEDAEHALLELAGLVGTGRSGEPAPRIDLPSDDAPLTGQTVGATVAAQLPDGAIVSVEGGTSGYPFFTASAASPPHTVLTNTGGAIGQGLPCALGAALAAPDRPVIAVQSDGSALYTAQALWTMSREQCNVTVLIAANHSYGVLRTELQRHGASRPGPQASALTSLNDPPIDWVALSRSFGVPATRADCVAQLRKSLAEAVASDGPSLVEMTL
jgi:acetolactate synthase I/II/III large subunit